MVDVFGVQCSMDDRPTLMSYPPLIFASPLSSSYLPYLHHSLSSLHYNTPSVLSLYSPRLCRQPSVIPPAAVSVVRCLS